MNRQKYESYIIAYIKKLDLKDLYKSKYNIFSNNTKSQNVFLNIHKEFIIMSII